MGSNWQSCNERFYSDLRAACERDLRTSIQVPAPTLSDLFRTRRVDGPPDPVRLTACYGIASTYYTGVQAGVVKIKKWLDTFNKAQDKQRRYEEWVARIKNSSSQLGFYRQQDRPEVYLVYRSGFYCHVENRNQMEAFGGFDKIQVVSSLNLNGTNTGDCGWPNGFFRRSNQAEVYRMYGDGIPEFNIGDRYCHVANEAQMIAFGGFGQVRVVSSSSDTGRGRNSTGTCSNP